MKAPAHPEVQEARISLWMNGVMSVIWFLVGIANASAIVTEVRQHHFWWASFAGIGSIGAIWLAWTSGVGFFAWRRHLKWLNTPETVHRNIETHWVNGCNEALTICVLDEPGAGGANHRYLIHGRDEDPVDMHWLDFQKGPIAGAGVNGITQEALIAVLIDRLEGFQRGPFACANNAYALQALQDAQRYLQDRTRFRIALGIEGTQEA